jgi:L-lactate dehydrogenase
MKVSIIGGGGRVGSSAAFALQCAGIISQIHLLDANAQSAEGEALDLMHGSSVIGGQRIYAGDYDLCRDADIVLITAGLRRKPDESRLDLINRNVSLFRQILNSLKDAALRSDAILFVVSNPVDILTRLAMEQLQYNPARVIGLGTQLDTARFRSLIAEKLNLPPTQVKALILGEHGESMVPIWSSATAAGLPLVKWPGFGAGVQQQIYQRTRDSGAECLKLKGGAGYAVALTIAEVIHAIALDRPAVLPVSTQLVGEYGIRGTCLSVPTMITRNGVAQRYSPELWPREVAGIQASAASLETTWQKLA